jgi:Zn-dependent protease with chaperone function
MLTDLVARYRVSTLELRTQLDGRLHNRSLRLGRRAWIVLAPTTMGDERALPFVLAHEVGHVVRNDSRRGLALIPLRTSLLCAAIMVGTVTAAAVAFAGLLVWTVGTRWATEFAADAFAVRWVGADGFHAFLDQHRAGRRHPANRALRYRLGRSTAWLRHPPVRLRLWRADRIAPQ